MAFARSGKATKPRSLTSSRTFWRLSSTITAHPALSWNIYGDIRRYIMTILCKLRQLVKSYFQKNSLILRKLLQNISFGRRAELRKEPGCGALTGRFNPAAYAARLTAFSHLPKGGRSAKKSPCAISSPGRPDLSAGTLPRLACKSSKRSVRSCGPAARPRIWKNSARSFTGAS